MSPSGAKRSRLRQPRSSHPRIALAIFALLAGIYLLTTGAHTSSKDEELLFGVTESLAVWQSFALNAARPYDTPIYSYYGPGQPFTAIPLYLIGRSMAGLFPHDAYPWVTRAITLWLNPLVTAATAALVYLAAVFIGYKQRAAIATALIYGLATMAWHYSKTFFAEPLTGLLLFASFVLVLYDHTRSLLSPAPPAPAPVKRHGGCNPLPPSPLPSQGEGEEHLPDTPSPLGGGKGKGGTDVACNVSTNRSGGWGANRWYTSTPMLLFLSGLLAGYSLIVKVHGALVIPFVVVYAGFGLLCVDGLRMPSWAEIQQTVIPRLAMWGAGMLVMLLLLGLYQWHLYGNPLMTGYGTGVFSHFNPKYFWYRLSGLVWSPGRGIIWYAPPVLLMPVGLWLLWRRSWQVVLICIGVTLAHLGFYALLLYWHGGGSWGPRYLVIALPFMILPLAPLLERSQALPKMALVCVLLLAIPPQLGSILIANEAFFSTKRNVERDHFDPWDSAIAGHLGLIAKRLSHYYDLAFATESVVFRQGFSYSEGEREDGEQVPRWTDASPALIQVRPGGNTHGATVLVSLAPNGCLPPPLSPTPIKLIAKSSQATLIADTPCPPRHYQVALPATDATLALQSRLWRPADVGIDREGGLGVQVRQLNASVVNENGQYPLTLRGELIPISPMPTGYVSIRRWTGDHRLAHWDVWLWYVSFSDLPPGPLRLLVGIWLTLALGLGGWGGYTLWRLRSPPA